MGDPQFGGLPITGADGEPIWEAYEQYDAASFVCRTCGAEADHACVNTITNRTRKIPCVSRMVDAVRYDRRRTEVQR
ncbi:hypothetical protein SEA_GUDMIT_61 [Gordonia phage Gudmit]|nr:hypothetical protein SEA_GUDMIT_61 [Gordonia phage Gudmit]